MNVDANVELNFIRKALDQSAIVAITDANGVINHVNDKFCEISKYSRDELLGKTHSVINSGVHPIEFFKNMWSTIRNGQIWEAEVCNRAKDGSIYWVYTTIVPFLNSEKKPEQYVSIRYEITDRKLAEEKLKVYAQKLEESNRDLQDFASVAAHDLQEPLRKIQAFGERLQKKSLHNLDPESQDFLKRMMSSAQRMQCLIDDLLSYARVSSKHHHPEVIDLKKMIMNICTDLEVRIEQTQAKIEFDTITTIEADYVQIQQVFLNLINNAIKFHKPGIPPRIQLSQKFDIEKQRNIISIKDNGIGVEEKYLEKIFKIFQRLHPRQSYEGTGIGLSICRRIIEKQNGRIFAKSIFDLQNQISGTEFIVELPILNLAVSTVNSQMIKDPSLSGVHT